MCSSYFIPSHFADEKDTSSNRNRNITKKRRIDSEFQTTRPDLAEDEPSTTEQDNDSLLTILRVDGQLVTIRTSQSAETLYDDDRQEAVQLQHGRIQQKDEEMISRYSSEEMIPSPCPRLDILEESYSSSIADPAISPKTPSTPAEGLLSIDVIIGALVFTFVALMYSDTARTCES